MSVGVNVCPKHLTTDLSRNCYLSESSKPTLIEKKLAGTGTLLLSNTRMETTFYHDDGMMNSKAKNSVSLLKKSMTLDFGTGVSKPKKFSALLSSPDVQMLKLASPELEKLICQASNGGITTTPTPTQYLYPKFVTEEQEAYARGFVDALNELHNNDPPSKSTASGPLPAVTTLTSVSNGTCHYEPVSSAPQTYATLTTTTLPGGVAPATTQQNTFSSAPVVTSTQNITPIMNTRVMQVKEEPQIVPCLGNTPPLSPIDMKSQERIKLERKRSRNRVAARKCRMRKLERISRLEVRVDDLKGQNTDLQASANKLRDQVCQLKQQIMEHVNSGCQVMLSQNLNL